MAKKRKIMRARRPKTMAPAAANVIVIITIALLILNGILAIVLSDWIIQQIEAAALTVTISKSALLTYGITWLIISVLACITNNKIRANFKANQLEDQSWMWFLLVISVVTVFLGRLESGILLMIASLMYLIKARKLLKK